VGESLLEADRLAIRFGGLTAVEDVSFSLQENRILAIIGPNGAGKTTIFNMISGLYVPSRGRILFRGAPLNRLPPHRIARMGIARTFQASRLFSNLSVLDNVLLGMQPHRGIGIGRAILRRGDEARDLRESLRKAEELLGFFGLDPGDKALRRSGDLPQGDRRKLEICRALAADPRVVLLDEPSAGMDPGETRELMEDIRRMRARSPEIGVILIEHDMSVVRGVADHILVLNYGRLIAQGGFEEIAADPGVQEAYLGRRRSYA
jgi:branched-chain amino acid transport system ATP-binding protein